MGLRLRRSSGPCLHLTTPRRLVSSGIRCWEDPGVCRHFCRQHLRGIPAERVQSTSSVPFGGCRRIRGVRPDTLSEHRRLYLLGKVIVSRYYRRPLTLAAVARAISTSPRQLQRAYAQFGDSFGEDLFVRRMSVAAQLLVEQRAIPVGDVGRLVGYPHSSHFASAFRRRYGLSPALFRERALRHAATHGRAGSHPRRPVSPRPHLPGPAARPPAV
jgi:AraC-like DNA-binding protein